MAFWALCSPTENMLERRPYGLRCRVGGLPCGWAPTSDEKKCLAWSCQGLIAGQRPR